MNLPPKEGVGNAGCPLHPRPRVHLVVVERTRVTTSTPESPGIPARNGFNGFLRALPGDRYRMHTSLLQRLAKTDSLVGVGLAEGDLMSMEVGLGRFGDRRLEKGGRRCMRPSFDGLVRAFDALQGTGRRRCGSRVFCAMKG